MFADAQTCADYLQTTACIQSYILYKQRFCLYIIIFDVYINFISFINRMVNEKNEMKMTEIIRLDCECVRPYRVEL